VIDSESRERVSRGSRTLKPMTREVRIVSGADATLHALREALTADGPAILPRAVPGAPSAPHGPVLEGTAGGSESLTVDRAVALVIETSGTSGQPKRVAIRGDALLASAAASESALGGHGQWLLALPSHYIAGINVLVRSLAAGLDPVVLEGAPFDVNNFARATQLLEGPVVFTSLVPAQLVRLLAEEEGIRALRRFERVLVGGQSTPAGVLAQAEAQGVQVTRTYGSSETSGGCVYDGVPIGRTLVRIVAGQIEVSSPTLAECYMGDPARTDSHFVVDDGVRWYRTGDAGELVDGVLSVTGRLDDVIISGGVKISLGAVERVVRALPGLEDAVVIRQQSDSWGEVPVVFTSTPVDLAEVRAAVASALGRGAAPERIVVVETIPLLASGKPNVQELRLTLGHNEAHGQ
jgi:O-succinylbenzoic acid--CoA ligase